jgi:hypothetical protein
MLELGTALKNLLKRKKKKKAETRKRTAYRRIGPEAQQQSRRSLATIRRNDVMSCTIS